MQEKDEEEDRGGRQIFLQVSRATNNLYTICLDLSLYLASNFFFNFHKNEFSCPADGISLFHVSIFHFQTFNQRNGWQQIKLQKPSVLLFVNICVLKTISKRFSLETAFVAHFPTKQIQAAL